MANGRVGRCQEQTVKVGRSYRCFRDDTSLDLPY